jgi:hypothetical protein
MFLLGKEALYISTMSSERAIAKRNLIRRAIATCISDSMMGLPTPGANRRFFALAQEVVSL